MARLMPRLSIAGWGVLCLATLAFYPVLLTEYHVAKGYTYFLFLVGLLFVLFKRLSGSHPAEHEQPPERLFLFWILLYVFYVYLTGYWGQQAIGHGDTLFSVASETLVKFMLPLVLIPLFHFLKVGLRFYRALVILAGMVILATFMYDLGTGHARYSRLFGQPIVYGDLAMLTGVLLLVTAWFEKGCLLRMLMILLGTAGVAASLYSGSRGGWILLLTLPLIFVVGRSWRTRWGIMLGWFVGMTIIFAALYVSVPAIKQRLDLAVHDFKGLIDKPDVYHCSSIGARISMWRIGLQAVREHPWTGIGLGNFYAYKKRFIEKNGVPKCLMRYKHEHSMYMTALVSTGVLGSAMLGLLFWGLYLFFRNRISLSSDHVLIALSGLVLLLAYLDFGLSESFLFTHVGSAAFFFLASLFIYLLSRRDISDACCGRFHL